MLVIGAGKMAQETLHYLTDAGPAKSSSLNRDFDRARRSPPSGTASRARGRISTNNSSKPTWLSAPPAPIGTIVTLPTINEQIARAAAISDRCSCSIWRCRATSIPRSATSSACTCTASTTSPKPASAIAKRSADALPAAEQIIDEEVRAFVAETHHRASGPVIARFREGLENVQIAELDTALSRLPELDDRSRRKSSNSPTGWWPRCSTRRWNRCATNLATALAHGLLEALQRLFQLEDPKD